MVLPSSAPTVLKFEKNVDLECFMFPEGVSGFTKDGEQIPDLQIPWFRLYLELLESKGINIFSVTFHLPDGSVARPFKIDGKIFWNTEKHP